MAETNDLFICPDCGAATCGKHRATEQCPYCKIDQLKAQLEQANALLREWGQIADSIYAFNAKMDEHLECHPVGQDSPATGDMAFIQHIQQHLEPGQEVLCKICGKTAREIIGGPK